MWKTPTPPSTAQVQARAKVTMPLQAIFWGDRYGKVKDPFGHVMVSGSFEPSPTAAWQRVEPVRSGAYLFQQAHEIVRMLFLHREDPLHHAARGGVVVAEVSDHLA